MQLLDGVGPCDVEYLIAAFEMVPPEVIGAEVLELETRSRGAVEDEHAVVEGGEVRIVGPRSGEGRENSQFHCWYRLPVRRLMSLRLRREDLYA